jgi:hypothetical protein
LVTNATNAACENMIETQNDFWEATSAYETFTLLDGSACDVLQPLVSPQIQLSSLAKCRVQAKSRIDSYSCHVSQVDCCASLWGGGGAGADPNEQDCGTEQQQRWCI